LNHFDLNFKKNQ